MTDKRVVFTTCGSVEEARQIGREVVDQRLAACVNIVPRIESIYRWQGEVETGEEWLLIIKTTADALANLYDTVRKLHSYDVPECIALAVEDGSPAYLQWINDSVV
jgi:periplasmic divalent cation tolerance protein